MSAERELQRQNERLDLLLNLTSRITSSLDLREVLRSIAANIREVILADAVVVGLPDAASGKFRVFAVDFPHGKDLVKEELLVAPSAAHKRAIDTLKPVVFDTWERDELGPELYDIAAAEGVKTGCSIPLVNRGRALGLLSILRKTETPFSPAIRPAVDRAVPPGGARRLAESCSTIPLERAPHRPGCRHKECPNRDTAPSVDSSLASNLC
jgi:transcriptional regulator with GAF, ATPase, and Fis domain